MSNEEKTPKQRREDKIVDRLGAAMARVWLQSGKQRFQDGLTAKEAAEAVMPVIEPLLNALDEVASAAERITKSHAHFVQDSFDPGAEATAAEWEMVRVLRKLQYFEPHDWTYISRFSATPREIHKILKAGLCEDVHLNYQRFISEEALKLALDEAHNAVENESGEPGCWHDGGHTVIKNLDPEKNGFRFPVKLIDPK